MVQQVLTQPFVRGLALDQVASRLRRCAIIEDALARALGAWLAHASDPPLKPTLLRHLEEDERHAARLRLRASDGLGRNGSSDSDPDLEHWLEQPLRARDTVEWLAGLYGVVKPVLADAYRELIAAADPARDQATLECLRDLLRDEEAQIDWGLEQLRRLAASPAARERADDWAEYLRLCLRAAGDVWGDMPRCRPPYRPGFSDRGA